MTTSPSVRVKVSGARGPSNYELWLGQGHTGTVPDYLAWAASLAAGATIYGSTAAGLAGTADGGYFLVVGSGDIWATLYQNVSGSAVQIAQLPSNTLRTQLADVAVGARLIGRRRISTWESRDVDASLDDKPVCVFENFTPAQIAAVRAGSPITFLADAINEMLSDVSVSGGGRVFLPIGAYDLRATVVLPPLVEFEGEGLGLLAGYDPGLVRGSGTVLAKNHNGHCITVTGAAANSLSAGIRNIIISSNRTTYPTGSGIVVDKVGGYRISEVKIFGVGEDGLVLGVTVGDVTTQIHLNGIYINNPGAVCIRNRSKWLKALQVETDGGTHGLFNLDAPNIDFTQFHFEGASQKAVVLAGANGNSRFAGGYIGLTNLASTKGIELASAAGNTDIEFDHVHIVGHAGITAGIEIGAAAWRTAARNCTLGSLPVGVLTVASDTEISSTAFVGCALPIDQQGNYPRFFGNRFEATTGNWAIDQKAGSGGIISGNVTDKPFRPATTAITFTAALTAAISGTLNANWAGATGPYTITFSDGSIRTATLTNGSAAVTWTGAVTATANATAANKIGDFGTNIVKDNPGFKTSARGKTAAIASGTVIPHGMSVTPYTAFLRSPSASLPADFAYTWDGTNITPTWTGGLSFVLVWEAFAVCENP